MSGWKKLASAAAASGEALNVEDVFSTYLYEGTGATQTITNGIDLDGEGGLIFFKDRGATSNWAAFDTERGVQKRLIPSGNNAEYTANGTTIDMLSAFNSDGFTLGSHLTANTNGGDFASWTWRKAPRFFDVVTYTGNGTAGRTVSHNLGSTPGCIIIKGTSSNYEWSVYHRGMDSTAPEDYFMWLNHTYARFDNTGYWNDTAPTSTQFTLGNNGNVNASGQTYVAYLFAHNDGDGEFGPNGDQDIIKCGSFTGTGSSAAIDLGFEPQFLLWKQYDGTDDWYIADSMRGITTQDINPPTLRPNLSNAENATSRLGITSTGFEFDGGNGSDYIYMAIRRGPMAVPESATDVFAIDLTQSLSSSTSWDSGFPVDMAIQREYTGAGDNGIFSRLTNTARLRTNRTNSEQLSGFDYNTFDSNEGWGSFPYAGSTEASWMWRRAPNFFDVVTYTGNATAGLAVDHNLGVAPEMMWVKNRGSNTSWHVYHSGMGNTKTMNLNGSGSEQTISVWNNTSPTDTQFTVGSSLEVNGYNAGMIAYLFATLSGVSKCGSYSGSSSAQNIDCGFSSGARFILIKCTNASDNWQVYDAERGIVAGNDPYLQLDSTTAEVSNSDDIDPYSSGFTLVGNRDATNAAGRDYIFYAIA